MFTQFLFSRLKVGAETLAEILNKLIEPLSYKAMVYIYIPQFNYFQFLFFSIF